MTTDDPTIAPPWALEQFLEHLCLKAGIEKKAWRDKTTTLEIYEVEYFSEE